MENPTVEVLSKYQFRRRNRLDHLKTYIEILGKISNIVEEDKKVQDYLKEHLEKLKTQMDHHEHRGTTEALECYASFLPPRLVEACIEGSLIPFFGSGISISAGIPTWNALLQTLGITSDYISDPHAENDPLTQAELIAHDIGTDSLQQKLRDQMEIADKPSLAHYLLAALRLPVYITTNYDSLFEKAWETLWKKEKLLIVTNDANVMAYGLNSPKIFPNDIEDKKSVLIKMHGDTNDEGLLILTRSDYRRHYRSNNEFFELVKDIIQSGYVLFLGFGHRDPEVSRLVEDVVYRYEHEDEVADEHTETRMWSQRPPTLYSIQFEMRHRTPDVFAARGIVALRPPAVIRDFNANQIRSASLAVELGELMAAAVDEDHTHRAMSLKAKLEDCIERLSQDIAQAMNVLKEKKDSVYAKLAEPDALQADLEEIIQSISPLGLVGQGVYVTESNGDIVGLAVPDGLNAAKRNEKKEFADRPYFRQAKAFRKPFVSDVLESAYNKHSTIFLCMPLGSEKTFEGLLFAAAQPGDWKLPVMLRDECWGERVGFVLVDSNGIAVVPPIYEVKPMAPVKKPEGESDDCNQGFPYKRVQEISRRDSHIIHVVQNVVPVGWDDDVHDVSADLRLYSMVADVPQTRWKLALSRSVPSNIAKTV